MRVFMSVPENRVLAGWFFPSKEGGSMEENAWE